MGQNFYIGMRKRIVTVFLGTFQCTHLNKVFLIKKTTAYFTAKGFTPFLLMISFQVAPTGLVDTINW